MFFGLNVQMFPSAADISANDIAGVVDSFTTADTIQETKRKIDLDTTIKLQTQQFKMPISYLDNSDIHVLTDIVSADMELVKTDNDMPPMYDYLFRPTNAFAKHTIPLWNAHYTTNAGFLTDTQEILAKMPPPTDDAPINCEKIAEIWGHLKTDAHFLEKYSYLEWDILKQFNQSESFLQCMSFLNLTSPIMSLLIPVFVLTFPFLILQFQGIPITFATYLEVLKEIAKNHFIGKTLLNMHSLRFDQIMYFIFSFAFYVLQIYQNITCCFRFYRNIQTVNENLLEIRRYTESVLTRMDNFIEIASPHCFYYKFCQETIKNREHLRRLRGQLENVSDFKPDIAKFGQTGYMLKCFYDLHSDVDYETGIRFSMGFLGYYDNLEGASANLTRGRIHAATIITDENKCSFKQQYYPALVDETPVKNDCEFDKNIIISAPNKAGKTTFLKTTAINIIFTQQVGCGFYASATLKPYSHIHSYLNIPDTSARDSLFQAESRRCKEILDIIGENRDAQKYRHFCIFDELYSGTNPEEACKAGCAFLKYLCKFSNVDFMLTTHYERICRRFNKSKKIENYKMEVRLLKDGAFQYTYRLKKGISQIKGAVRVLKDMDYPKEIIDSIEESMIRKKHPSIRQI
jgi:hypothetical protein